MYNQAPYVIQVNFYSAKVDNVYFPQHEVVGDIANAIWQIKERVQKQEHWDFGYFLQSRTKMLDHFKIGQDDDRFPLVPQRIVRDVREVMPDNGVVALDNGMYKIWFARLYPAVEPNALLLDNALATMGAGLPSAMAVALLNPERKVLAVVGDGGFMMNSQELETCVRLQLNIVVAVLNDSGFGMIKWKQKAEGLPKFGLEYGNPDFVAYAESYGVKGYRVNSAKELLPLLKEVLDEPGPKLVEIPVAYDWANELLDKELPGKLQEQASVPKTPIPAELRDIVEGIKPAPLSLPKGPQTPGAPEITQDTARQDAFLKARERAEPLLWTDAETPKTVPKSTSQI